MGDRVEQSHSGPGDNVAGDKNITVQPTSQQGIVGNDSTTINIQTVEQRFEAKTLEPTIDGPPNNLKVYGLPRDRFVGRDADLARLDELLQTQTQVAIAGVSGLGGVGKSELALQYAREHLGDYPGGVVWLRAAAACGELVAFAQPRWFAQVDFTQLDTLEKQAAFCQAHWPKTADDPPGRVLLILDDVTDFAAQVKGFPVVGDRFRVLFTSREQWLNPESQLDLGLLEPAAALTLLSNFVGQDRIAAEQATAEALCEWLGYLPLGLELVGTLLRSEPDWSIQFVLERIKGEKLQHEAMGEIEIAFNISWQQLSPAPRQLAVLLGCFGNGPIPWELVEATVDRCETQPRRQRKRDRLWQWMTRKSATQPEQWCLLLNRDRLAQCRRRLVELSLLERTGTEEYTLHPLIREFFAQKSTDRSDALVLKTAVAEELLKATESISQAMTIDQVQALGNVIPHAQSVAKWTDHTELGSPLARLNRDLCYLYYAQGLFGLAETWAMRSLEICERVLGADHPNTAASLNNLAELYRSQGRYEAAEPLYRRALDIHEQVLGADHTATATSLNNLALLYESQGRYEAAEPLHRRALNIHEQVLGADHTATATSLNNLALLYKSQGRYEATELLFGRSLEIREQVLGANHPATAQSLNNLAGLYEFQGRYEAAEPLYRRALEIRERVLGADHPSTATSLNNLASLYYSQERYAEAEPFFRRCLEIALTKLGQDHPNTQTFGGNFITFMQTVIEVDRAADLSDHPLTQSLLQQLTTPPSDPA